MAYTDINSDDLLLLAFLKQPFQRFHPKGLKTGAIVEGELTQLMVQFGWEPEQHPFRCIRAGTASWTLCWLFVLSKQVDDAHPSCQKCLRLPSLQTLERPSRDDKVPLTLPGSSFCSLDDCGPLARQPRCHDCLSMSRSTGNRNVFDAGSSGSRSAS